MFFSELAMRKVIELGSERPDCSVLDIGCGKCEHTEQFCKSGLKVTGLDILDHGFRHENFVFYETFFDQYEWDKNYDFVWASHVIEHMLDPQAFLVQAKEFLKPDGWLCLTFPPLKNNIVGGHVNLFNAGIIMYRAVLAGFDCSNVKIHKYGYNVSVFIQNSLNDVDLNSLNYDNGDIEKISKYLPEGHDRQDFNGDIKELNWI